MSLTNTGPAEAGATRPWPADLWESWPIEQLIRYANNPRLHSEADRRQNCGLHPQMGRWGWTMPVLVDENGVVIAGHARLGAAAKLKLTLIPVIVARAWSRALPEGVTDYIHRSPWL